MAYVQLRMVIMITTVVIKIITGMRAILMMISVMIIVMTITTTVEVDQKIGKFTFTLLKH